MEFKIEKGIKVPVDIKYPWRKLEVGDSFFVKGKTSREIAGSVFNASKRLNTKYTQRKEGDGVRVWRVK